MFCIRWGSHASHYTDFATRLSKNHGKLDSTLANESDGSKS